MQLFFDSEIAERLRTGVVDATSQKNESAA